ncbi:MAG: hypothetical protein H7839_12555 [Magnetococcus sp. YQC-5]
MSSTRQAVVFGPSLYAGGYFPDLTPFHQEAAQMGIIARICGIRTKPIAGSYLIGLTALIVLGLGM